MKLNPRPVALQTWSVRDHWGEDPLACIQSIAEIGYDAIELHGCDPALIEDLLPDIRGVGLTICGYHAMEDRLVDPSDILGWAERIGCPLLVCPYTNRRTGEEFSALLDILDRAHERAASRSIAVAYHNHDFEFARRDDGSRIIDELLARDALQLEIDLGWAWHAGEDPAAFYDAHSHRCAALHLKDLTGRPSGPPPAGEGDELYCPLGDGACSYDKILSSLANKDDLCPIIVEYDASPTCDTLEAAARSLNFVRTHFTPAPSDP